MNSPRTAAPARRRTRQFGFTLVEIAIALAVFGVLATLVFKAQGVVEQHHQAEFVTRVRTLEAQLKSYRSTFGRWPGDCNRDGLLDWGFVDITSLVSAENFDYAIPTSLAAAASSSDTYALGKTCPAGTLAPWAQVNVPYNELKLADLHSAGEPNRKAAAHGLGGYAFLGTFTVNPGAAVTENQYNAIVLTHVPIASARRLAVAIDGADGSASNLNRVRRTDDLVSFAPVWTAAGETEARLITVVIFFDRIPPASV